MRVVWLTKFGPPEVLVPGEAPTPMPAAGQVLLRIAAVGIPFVDTQVRAGNSPRPGPPPALPLIPGNNVGGVVADVGPGVDRRLLGRRCVAATGGRGGYAEFVALDEAELITVPEQLALTDAVALLADGRTALGLRRAARIEAGERVLITAAAGGLGTLLLQLARADGAGLIVAAAGSERKLSLAKQLGADVVVDYGDGGWPEEVRSATGGAGIDVTFDGVGGTIGRAAFELTAQLGRFMLFGLASGSVTPASMLDVLQRGLTVIGGAQARPGAEARALTVEALELAAAGQLSPVVGQTFALEKAAEAHAAIEARLTLGKTLLTCDASDGAGE
jgi:NADPH2:quinone reductase